MSRYSTPSTALAALALLAAMVVLTPTAAAQDPSPPDASQSSAALPFVGEFQVWCTDRNPSPFNLCSSHHGSPAIDIGMPVGTPLYSTGTGEVIIARGGCTGSGSCNNGAGNWVAILHPDGTYSRYLHMDVISVTAGQDVLAGELLGTNGVTGHSSSPHLHYDEQQPLGNRIDFGTFIGCVDGEQVEYPAAFGTDDWNEVEYGSLLVNEDYDCHADSAPTSPSIDDLEPSPSPRILEGPTAFAVTAPPDLAGASYEVSVSFDGDQPQLQRIGSAELLRFEASSRSAEIRGRLIVDDEPESWSDVSVFEPDAENTTPTCDGLYATQSSFEGSPQADVIIGTAGSDVVNGNGGNDILCGGERSSNEFSASIFGGVGRDILNGGDGDDILIGGAGPDLLDGGDGVDSYDGGFSFDRCADDPTADEATISCEFS